MLGLRLNHVSKRGHIRLAPRYSWHISIVPNTGSSHLIFHSKHKFAPKIQSVQIIMFKVIIVSSSRFNSHSYWRKSIICVKGKVAHICVMLYIPDIIMMQDTCFAYILLRGCPLCNLFSQYIVVYVYIYMLNRVGMGCHKRCKSDRVCRDVETPIATP